MSNLQEFHHHLDDAPDKKSRTVVAIVIALVMAGVGFYVYESVWNPATHTIIADSQLPAH
jgi:uncharacterized membrane protein